MARRLLSGTDLRTAILLLGLVLFGTFAASAGEVATARWVDGLPPVLSIGDLRLTDARFAFLEPPPGEVATVYVVAGRKDGRPFSAAIVEKEGRASLVPIPEDWIQFPRRIATLTIQFPAVPPAKVTLGLQSRFADKFTYQWLEPVPIGSIRLSEPLPRFKAKLLDGEDWDAEELRGRVSVLIWWATSLPSCVDEIPALNALAEQFENEPAVAFVALSPESRRTLERFLKEHPFASRQLSARQGEEVFGDTPPRYVVLDRESRVVFDHLGWEPDIEDQILGAVGEALTKTSR